MADEFLTPEQLSERWSGSIKEQTLAIWRMKSTGPKFIKLGNKILYKISDVEAYEADNTQGGK